MTYRCNPCVKGFRMMYILSRVTGIDPGRDWTTRLWPGPKFFWCHRIRIEHVEKPGKRILHHQFILSEHQIRIVQSFRVIHHYPGHNSAEPGPIRIILVSLESWSIGLQFSRLKFLHLHTFYLSKNPKTPKKGHFWVWRAISSQGGPGSLRYIWEGHSARHFSIDRHRNQLNRLGQICCSLV